MMASRLLLCLGVTQAVVTDDDVGMLQIADLTRELHQHGDTNVAMGSDVAMGSGMDSKQVSGQDAAIGADVAIGSNSAADLPIPGAPYIIRNKYDGDWYDAELAFDNGGKVTVEFDDPTPWTFKKVGQHWRIVNLYGCPSHDMCNAPLSWDYGDGSHPYCRLKHDDPVDWDLKPSNGYWRIVNKDHGWKDKSWSNAELSWDSDDPYPTASVEEDDPVDWEIIPAMRSEGHWMPEGNLISKSGTTVTWHSTYGTSRTNTWSESSDFTSTVSAELSYGVGWGAFSASGSISASDSFSKGRSFSKELSANSGTDFNQTLEVGPNASFVWKWIISVKSNHYIHRHTGTVDIETKSLEATPSYLKPPRCKSGCCKINTGCQDCVSGGWLR